MQVYVNFHGYYADVDPEDIIDNSDLTDKSTDAEILAAISEDIDELVREELPGYQHDGYDIVEKIKEILAERKAEEAEEEE